jgi:hypothetical protein
MSETTWEGDVGEAEEEGRKRGRSRTPYLDTWRKLVRPLVTGGKLTKPSIQTIIDKTIEWFADDLDDSDRKLTASHFIELGVREQKTHLLPYVEKPKAPPQQLKLLNEVYSIDGAWMRLGTMTPTQIEKYVYAEIDEQISDLRGKKREITKLVNMCRSRSRPLQDQLF